MVPCSADVQLRQGTGHSQTYHTGVQMTTRKPIDAFFASKAFAVVGVSADRKKFGNIVFRKMQEIGFRVLPVHPTLEAVEGETCYRSVSELPAEVQSVVTVIPPSQTERVIPACVQHGVKSIWMQPGSSSKQAVSAALDAGIHVIEGQCILMFLEPVQSVHKVHRWISKLVGTYPR